MMSAMRGVLAVQFRVFESLLLLLTAQDLCKLKACTDKRTEDAHTVDSFDSNSTQSLLSLGFNDRSQKSEFRTYSITMRSSSPIFCFQYWAMFAGLKVVLIDTAHPSFILQAVSFEVRL